MNVFTGKDRESMTPCMVAFEKWWNEGGSKRGLQAMTAWAVFRSGYWAAEDRALGLILPEIA